MMYRELFLIILMGLIGCAGVYSIGHKMQFSLKNKPPISRIIKNRPEIHYPCSYKISTCDPIV